MALIENQPKPQVQKAQEVVIKDLEQALRHFIHEATAGKGKVIGKPAPWCYKVGAEIQTPLGTAIPTVFYVFFKRDWFFTFKYQFPNVPVEDRGFGQTISYDTLGKAFHDNATIAIVMQSGAVYTITAKEWHTYVQKYKTWRGTEVNNNNGNAEASIPAKMMRRVNPEK